MKLFALCLAIVLCSSVTLAATNTVLCYYGSWAQYRDGNGQFGPGDVPADKCSHIVYAFILPTADGGIQDFTDAGTLNQLLALKQSNPNLKVLAAMGGWTAGSTDFSNIVSNDASIGTFVDALYTFVDQYQLDGIDIDWEYPGYRGGSDSDNVNFVNFLRALRGKFGSEMLITAAVGNGLYFIGPTYDVAGMNQYLDFINLMTYDFHAYYDGVTGQNSPLYDTSNPTLNADATVTAWINAGASPSKLLMGLGFYGQDYQLSDPSDNGVGAAVSGPGDAGPFTHTDGYKSFLEICSDLIDDGWTTVYDDQQQCPYSCKGDQWVGYDNVESITAKAQYAVDKGLGGVMMWSVDLDDLRNVCGAGAMPLLSAISSVIPI